MNQAFAKKVNSAVAEIMRRDYGISDPVQAHRKALELFDEPEPVDPARIAYLQSLTPLGATASPPAGAQVSPRMRDLHNATYLGQQALAQLDREGRS